MTMESPKSSATNDDASDIMAPAQDAADQTSTDGGVISEKEPSSENGILGSTLRELLIVGVWLVAFVISFLPLVGEQSIWMINIQWLLPIGLPTVAVFLLVLRRFSPDGIRGVGSLGIDQFASVAFSVSAVLWVGMLWSAVSCQIQYGVWTLGWSGIVQLIAALALVVLTVFAPLFPTLGQDFLGRPTTLAHRNANPVRSVIAHQCPVPPAPIPDPAPAEDVAEVASGVAATADAPLAYSASRLDAELSGQQATDEVTRLDLAAQVPLAAHASGGSTGTEDATTDEEYVPSYLRRSRLQEMVSDSASIEALVASEPDVELEADPMPVSKVLSGDAVASEAIVLETSEDDARATFLEADVAEDIPVQEQEAAVEDLFVAEDTAQEATSQQAVPSATRQESVTPEASSGNAAPRYEEFASQPFWILAPSERDVHDERGEPLFRIGPTAWALVIEDRGGAFVVRHDDGRIGYLQDISDITKG